MTTTTTPVSPTVLAAKSRAQFLASYMLSCVCSPIELRAETGGVIECARCARPLVPRRAADVGSGRAIGGRVDPEAVPGAPARPEPASARSADSAGAVAAERRSG